MYDRFKCIDSINVKQIMPNKKSDREQTEVTEAFVLSEPALSGTWKVAKQFLLHRAVEGCFPLKVFLTS